MRAGRHTIKPMPPPARLSRRAATRRACAFAHARTYGSPPMNSQVRHCRRSINGIDIFYREAGPPHAPVVLLPHGYPCSSYEFRNLMPRLADRWRLVAPDFPGAGHSATPDDFDYSFDGYAAFLDSFVQALDRKSTRLNSSHVKISY